MAFILVGFLLWGGGSGQLIPGLPFKDSDDVMRMLQVLALHDGGGWYDLTQYRINPPHGLAMHWSRLPDLPMLGVLALTEPWLGRDEAILLAATLVPVVLGVGYFYAFVWAARPLYGTAGSAGMAQAGLIVMAAFLPLLSFSAGRIDHHGWQLLLAVLQAGALLRIAAGARGVGLPFLAGLCAALGLWIGAEAIPILAFAALALISLWWREGGQGAWALTLLGLSAMIAALLILPLASPPDQRWVTVCDAFSLVSLGLTAAVALFGLGANLGEWRELTPTPSRRVILAFGQGLPLLALLVLAFPQCLAGPYGLLSPEAAELVANTGESVPMGTLLVDKPATATYLLFLPVVALAIAGWRLAAEWRTPGSPWPALFILLVGSFILPWWQTRGIHLTSVYAALALTWPAVRLSTIANRQPTMARRIIRRVGPALLVVILPGFAALAVAALEGGKEEADGLECDLTPAIAYLNQPALRQQAPLLVAAHDNHSAPLLWSTPHAVLGGLYHRNAAGLRDNQAILTQDEAGVREVVLRRGVDFLLLCPAKSQDQNRGQDLGRAGKAKFTFPDRLLAGAEAIWLERVPIPGQALLLRVVKEGEGGLSPEQNSPVRLN